MQERDYRTLKELVAAHVATGKDGGPEGVATIEIGIEALKLAEYLTPELEKQFAEAATSA